MSAGKPDSESDWVDLDDAPELDDDWFDRAEIRLASKRGAKQIRSANDRYAPAIVAS